MSAIFVFHLVRKNIQTNNKFVWPFNVLFSYIIFFFYIFPTTKCLTSRQSSFFIFFIYYFIYQSLILIVSKVSIFGAKFLLFLCDTLIYNINMSCILYIRKKKFFFFPILLFYWKLYKNIKNNNLQRDDFDYKLFFDTNRIINSVDLIWNCFQIIK